MESNWRKSSYSNDNGGDCVETAADSGAILVRDTANRDGSMLSFTAEAWTAFLGTLRSALRVARVLDGHAAHTAPGSEPETSSMIRMRNLAGPLIFSMLREARPHVPPNANIPMSMSATPKRSPFIADIGISVPS